MEIRENLELANVEYANGGSKATMTFLDRENKQALCVNFNKQSYKDGKFVNDPEKEEKVEGWCRDIFGVSFNELPECVGVCKTVYVYDKFCSLFQVNTVEKFSDDMVGSIYDTSVKEVIQDDYAIRIRYDIDGNTYESKHSWGVFEKGSKQWFVDPQKKKTVYEKFEDKYGVRPEDAQSLVGHKLMVEVKKAFGNALYGDIKKFPKKK